MRTGQKLSPTGRINLIDTRQVEERFQQRGRGAISNQTGRFELETRQAFDDGWGTIEDDDSRMETLLMKDSARTIITFNKSPDISFDRTVNPYRGCEHGCIYCFARPTHAWGGLSAGLDFESKLFFKDNAVELLKRELSRPRYIPRVIAMGMNTDAYQPVEREKRLTRSLLEVLSAHRHPLSLLTNDLAKASPTRRMGRSSSLAPMLRTFLPLCYARPFVRYNATMPCLAQQMMAASGFSV